MLTAFKGAGAGNWIDRLLVEKVVLKHIISIQQLGRYHRGGGSACTLFSNNGFASGSDELWIASMMLEQSGGFCQKVYTCGGVQREQQLRPRIPRWDSTGAILR
ncbi:hypothetical protein Tco_0365173 [Tanacetum coccineum]